MDFCSFSVIFCFSRQRNAFSGVLFLKLFHLIRYPTCTQWSIIGSQSLRGAWRDHCFPAAFSWFLHETALACLEITSAGCFSLKCQRKDSKKAKQHRRFRGVLGRWRTAAIDRTTFHACLRCRKTAVFAVFFSTLGCHLARESLSWPAMSVSNKKQEFEQRNRIKLFDDFWVRAYWFDFALRRRARARSM